MLSARENAIGLYMTGIRDGHPAAALDAHVGARYAQHSTGVKDGRDGFTEFFDDFIQRNDKREISVIRALQDDRHVFVHVHQSLNDGESEWVTTDFFDSDENGKIIEHWDVIDAFKAPNASRRTMIDGATEITDRHNTEANKALVATFIQTCLIDGQADRLGDFINEDLYLQHDPEVGDGLAEFRDLLAGPDREMTYQECFLIVGEGNFVATLNRARRQDQDLCQCDIFRIEDGKIVEHWNNSEPVPPKEEWANSGKF